MEVMGSGLGRVTGKKIDDRKPRRDFILMNENI